MPAVGISGQRGSGEVNLFAFYRDAVLDYLGRPSLSATDVATFTAAAGKIKRGFGQHLPIAYSAEATRLAYMLYYAPKHAIMWREYVSRSAFVRPDPFRLNSIGTACGSEIVGLLEGLGNPVPTRSDWWCFDTEPGWEPLLGAACALYETRRGCTLSCTCVPNLASLWPQGFTIGSLVLSEIVKQNGQRQFRQDVTDAIGPATGWFLDITKCRLADGSEPYVSTFYPFGYESLRNKGWNLKAIINAEINAEINACTPGWCLEPLTFEPSMHMFLARFR